MFAKLLASINTVSQPPDHMTNQTQQCGKPPCIDTGILATKWFMELLSLRGRTDVGLDLAFQTDYPVRTCRVSLFLEEILESETFSFLEEILESEAFSSVVALTELGLHGVYEFYYCAQTFAGGSLPLVGA